MERTSSFGYVLRRRRRALDLTQEQLAQQVGCALETIKKIEADARRPSRPMAERLADVLRVAPEERVAFLKAARAELAPDQIALPTTPLETPVPTGTTLPVGTVTFLFTDIAGSTQLWDHHPQGMAAALARHDALLRQAIERCGGQIFKTIGDACCAVFATAPDALIAALASQRALRAESWGATGPLEVRIALHSGVAELRDGDYFGYALSRVARLRDAGHAGQVLLSASAWELARDHLPSEVALRDLGEHRLKDLTRPEHIFQVIAPDLPTDFPPLKTLDRHTTNLPAQPTALIGREREVADVLEMLRRPEVRLVTLTGPGGIGKTRLALQVAAEALDDFAHGVYWVALARISDSGLVLGAIAQALAVKEGASQTLIEALLAYLREKQLLLLLDNFEQVLEAAPRIGELLAACPRLHVLATGREVLHLYGEHDFAVPPLALPPREPRNTSREPESDQAEFLSAYEAVRLFIARARAAKPDFAVTNQNAPAVAEICQRLDGLPLAIELAAARVRLFPPDALLARLESPLKLLTSGARDLPQRQQTLRAAIDWSYNLLDSRERVLFARLGVFVGGCTLEAAEAVCSAVGDLPLDVIDGVASLLDKSLLREVEGPGGEPRFVMLETIREYALERLENSGEDAALRERHALFYLALAEAAEPELTSAERPVWLARLAADYENLRAALAWSRATDGQNAIELHLAAALRWFWFFLGYTSEGRNWLQDALVRVGVPDRTYAQALCGIGMLCWLQGDQDNARARLEESVAIWRVLHDRRGLAYALSYLGLVVGHQFDYSAAGAIQTESIALFQAIDDQWGLALALGNMAETLYFQYDHAAAREHYERSAAIWRVLDDRWGLAKTLAGLGFVVNDQGDVASAALLFEESIPLLEAEGDKIWLAATLNKQGNVVRYLGDIDRAVACYIRSLELLRELGSRLIYSAPLHNLGFVALQRGQIPRAAAYFAESLAIARPERDTEEIGVNIAGLAGVAGAHGQLECAVRLFGVIDVLSAAGVRMLDYANLAVYDQAVAAVRTQFDEATFAVAWEAGKAMPLEQAIAEALAVAESANTSEL